MLAAPPILDLQYQNVNFSECIKKGTTKTFLKIQAYVDLQCHDNFGGICGNRLLDRGMGGECEDDYVGPRYVFLSVIVISRHVKPLMIFLCEPLIYLKHGANIDVYIFLVY